MAAVVYLMCAATALACYVLLWRGYHHTRVRLLFWSSLCFGAFTLENLLLFVDLIVVPTHDLLLYRRLVSLAAVSLLLYGMIWKSK